MTAPTCPECGQRIRRPTRGRPAGRKREALAVELVAAGREIQAVADLLGITVRTVREYVRRATYRPSSDQ